MFRHSTRRLARLIACLLLQVALLFSAAPVPAVTPQAASHHLVVSQAAVMAVHYCHQAHCPGHRHCGYGPACCLGASCTGLLSASPAELSIIPRSSLMAAYVPFVGHWAVGRDETVDLPPPRDPA